MNVSWGIIESGEGKKIACYSDETGTKKKVSTFEIDDFASIFTAFKGTKENEVTKRNVMENVNKYIYNLYLKILGNNYLVGEDQSFKDSRQRILSDFISKIKGNSELNKEIINKISNKKIKDLKRDNEYNEYNEFIKNLCYYSGVDENKYDDYYFIPSDNGIGNSILSFPGGNYVDSTDKLKKYTNYNPRLSQLINFTSLVTSTPSNGFISYLNSKSDNIFLKFVPDNDNLQIWLSEYENELKNKGFELSSEKEKVNIFALTGSGLSLAEQTVNIPKYVTESSTKNKEEIVDQIIKYGFLNNNRGTFITYATRGDVINFPQGEANYKIDKEIVKDCDIYNYGTKELDFNNRTTVGDYITNGLKYLYNNNTVSSLVNNNANIKAYFNSNCADFLKGYDNTFKEFNDVNNYYDFYSASTPYISLDFRYRDINTDKIRTVNINSVEHPFIKSFNCVDNGVKTFTIKLFDRDFNSLFKIIDKNKNKKTTIETTLEQVLALSVGINNTEQANEDEKARYSLTAANYGDVIGTKIENSMEYNLGIQFGYSETNPKLTKGTIGDDRKEKTGYLLNKEQTDGFTYAGSTRYFTNTNKEQPRTNRWWETSTDENKDDNKTLLVRANSTNQTTVRTGLVKTLIIGYQTEFSSAGIYYTIKAIEESQTELSKYKIYQRYTNIKGTPSEVLYAVMNMVNGIFDKRGGGIKLYIDDSCKSGGENVVIEDYEKEENQNSEDGKNLAQEPKQVQISLGSKDALSMYKEELTEGLKDVQFYENTKKPKLYKSVLSILNDLKAVMPPKVVDSGLMKDVIVTDQDGNSVKAIEKQNAYRRFTYGVQVDGDKVNVYFYYQKPTRFERIKKYEWGPANGRHSVITNIDIKTDNEYALLTSMSTITSNGASVISRDGRGAKIKSMADYADYISQPGDSSPLEQIAYAYSQALYKGTITIMGDPFYCFDKYVQPFTYPIYLDFRLPVSQSWASDKKSNVGYSHFMSGFYVVTKITHDINDSGFRTILEVMSYPNIAKDVLG